MITTLYALFVGDKPLTPEAPGLYLFYSKAEAQKALDSNIWFHDEQGKFVPPLKGRIYIRTVKADFDSE